MSKTIIERKYSKWRTQQIASSFDATKIDKLIQFYHENRSKFSKQDIYAYDACSLLLERDGLSSKRAKKKLVVVNDKRTMCKVS